MKDSTRELIELLKWAIQHRITGLPHIDPAAIRRELAASMRRSRQFSDRYRTVLKFTIKRLREYHRVNPPTP